MSQSDSDWTLMQSSLPSNICFSVNVSVSFQAAYKPLTSGHLCFKGHSVTTFMMLSLLCEGGSYQGVEGSFLLLLGREGELLDPSREGAKLVLTSRCHLPQVRAARPPPALGCGREPQRPTCGAGGYLANSRNCMILHISRTDAFSKRGDCEVYRKALADKS